MAIQPADSMSTLRTMPGHRIELIMGRRLLMGITEIMDTMVTANTDITATMGGLTANMDTTVTTVTTVTVDTLDATNSTSFDLP